MMLLLQETEKKTQNILALRNDFELFFLSHVIWWDKKSQQKCLAGNQKCGAGAERQRQKVSSGFDLRGSVKTVRVDEISERTGNGTTQGRDTGLRFQECSLLMGTRGKRMYRKGSKGFINRAKYHLNQKIFSG